MNQEGLTALPQLFQQTLLIKSILQVKKSGSFHTRIWGDSLILVTRQFINVKNLEDVKINV